MKLTLTVDLADEDAAAIATVKHTRPDNIAEIEDYLQGYLESAIEAAQADGQQDAAGPVAPAADRTPVFTETEVSDALHKACQDIIEAAQLPETGTRDALNLLINATLVRLREPDQTLEDVAVQSYAEPLSTILDWITD